MERLLAENAALRASYDALLIRYARLEERLDELLVIARQNQRKETKPKPAEPAPVLEGAEKIAFEDRPKPPEKLVKSKEKKKSKPTGRKKIPENLKAEKHTGDDSFAGFHRMLWAMVICYLLQLEFRFNYQGKCRRPAI